MKTDDNDPTAASTTATATATATGSSSSKIEEERRFDYVIVGAGPSAMGVLLGLLEQYQESTNRCSIAVVDRGGRVQAPDTLHLRDWYLAAHNNNNNNDNNPPPPGGGHETTGRTIATTTITGRTMDLPTGQGLGGTSNINAGIVMPPLPQDYASWPEPWRSSLPKAVDTIWKRLDDNGMLHKQQESSSSSLATLPTGTNGWHIDWSTGTTSTSTSGSGSGSGSSSSSSSSSTNRSATLEVKQDAEERSGMGTRTSTRTRTCCWKRRNYYEALIAPILANTLHNNSKKKNCCHVEWILDTQVQRLLLKNDDDDDDRGNGNTTNVVVVQGVECYTRKNDNDHDNDNDSPSSGESDFWYLHASRAVILCAGAVESPALLLTSGIGPDDDDDDSNNGNSNPHHFQGVGRHLKDQWLLPRTTTFLTRSWQQQQQQQQQRPPPASSYGTTTRTISSTNGISVLGHMKNGTTGETFQVAVIDAISHETILPSTLAMAIRWSCQSTFHARIRDAVFETAKTILGLLIRWSPLGFILRHFTQTTLLFLMHPLSEGHISIEPPKASTTSTALSHVEEGEPSNRYQQRRRNVQVKVDVRYCQDPRDVDAMYQAWTGLNNHHQHQHQQQSHLDDSGGWVGGFEVFPKWVFPPGLFSWWGLDWFSFFCRSFSQPYFHFSGTCAMKRDDQHLDWVVDSDRLRLRDHLNIYICDASVFPSTISSPPALTCCALGYAFSKTLTSTFDLPVQQDIKEESPS